MTASTTWRMSDMFEHMDGYEVRVTYTGTPYFPATFDEPSEGGFEEIVKVEWFNDSDQFEDITDEITDVQYDFLARQIVRQLAA